MTNKQNKPALLIVDDDPLITDALAFVLTKDFAVTQARSRSEAIALAQQQRPGLALVDLGLPPKPHRPDEGFALVRDLLGCCPDIKIIVLSGQNGEKNARHARALGAIDFIAKPCPPERIRSLLFGALNLPEPEETSQARCGLIGISPPMDRLRQQLEQYASAPFPVLIEGESGCGKELVASCLHRLSERANSPFLALNCAAIAPTLVEPTLFGHARGAFTGAEQAHVGYFENASHGTLFLDEIGELPLELQSKLLRVLENGEFQRVGETQTRISHARIVAATNRDLKKEVREGRFRADLYHRLSVFTLAAPPLRELGEDRLLLLEHFRRLFSMHNQKQPFTLTPEAEQAWQDYHFPGNVRELRNIVIRLSTKYPGQAVTLPMLEDEFDSAEALAQHFDLPADGRNLKELARKHLSGQLNFELDRMLKNWEQSYVEAALEMTHGNLSQAARLLGINRTTLYSRMQTYSTDE